MKALSLTQPWASLIALGHKRIETRSWRTSYRGELLIHAAVTMPAWCRRLAIQEQEHGMLPAGELPRGMMIATARLVDIKSTDELVTIISAQEQIYGDYGHRRFGWLLDDVRALREPVPCRGALGLWTVPQPVLDAIAKVEGR